MVQRDHCQHKLGNVFHLLTSHSFIGLREILLEEMCGLWWKWIIELVKSFLSKR